MRLSLDNATRILASAACLVLAAESDQSSAADDFTDGSVSQLFEAQQHNRFELESLVSLGNERLQSNRSLTEPGRLVHLSSEDGFKQPTSIDDLFQTVKYDCTDDGCGSAVCEPTWALVAPYVWMPAMNGSVGAQGNVNSVNLTLSELFDLISDINGAAMGHVEVGKGRRGLIIDGMLMQLAPTEPGPLGGTIDVETDLTILEALGMYRLLDAETGSQNFSNVKFDLLGGVRYYHVGVGVTVEPAMGPTDSREQSETWVDLVIGGRTSTTIAEGLDGFVRADFGGFGIGTSSTLAWNLEAGVKYDCAMCPGSSLLLGYKILDIDETKNAGSPEQFVFDVKLHGPFMAILFEL